MLAALASLLIAITSSVAARALVSLGFGFVTYAALTALATTVVAAVTTNYNHLSSDTLNILNMAGAGQGLGVILAALVTKASLQAIKKLRPI